MPILSVGEVEVHRFAVTYTLWFWPICSKTKGIIIIIIIIITIKLFIIIIPIYFKLGLDVGLIYEVPPHMVPEYCRFRLQPKQFHVIFHAFYPSLPVLPTHFSPATTTFLQANHPHP